MMDLAGIDNADFGGGKIGVWTVKTMHEFVDCDPCFGDNKSIVITDHRIYWWIGGGSNPRPSDCEPDALPN